MNNDSSLTPLPERIVECASNSRLSVVHLFHFSLTRSLGSQQGKSKQVHNKSNPIGQNENL